jgi:hypothetical protein
MFGKPKKKMSLESAILAGEIKEVRRSLEAGRIPTSQFPMKEVGIHCIRRQQQCRDHPVAHRAWADVNGKDAKGRTPLHIVAAGRPSIEKMELLIEHGADVNTVDNEGKTPLASVLQGTPVNSFFATLGVSPDEEETDMRNNAADFLRAHGAK